MELSGSVRLYKWILTGPTTTAAAAATASPAAMTETICYLLNGLHFFASIFLHQNEIQMNGVEKEIVITERYDIYRCESIS